MNTHATAPSTIARFGLALMAYVGWVTALAAPAWAGVHLNTSIAAQPDSPIRISSCIAMIVMPDQGNEQIAYSIAFTNVTSKTIGRLTYALTINPGAPNETRATKVVRGSFAPSVPIDARYAGMNAGVTGPAAATTPNLFPHIIEARCSVVSVWFDDSTTWNAQELGSSVASMPARTPPPLTATPAPDQALNRVGITYPIQERGLQNNVNQAIYNQLMSDSTSSGGFTPVAIEDGITFEQAYDPRSVCEAKHVHALIYALVGGDVGGDRSEVKLLFRVVDCSGTTIFLKRQSRGVNTVWSLKGPEKIAKDISSGLLNDAEKDFAAFMKDNQGLWSSVLYTGVPVDPKSVAYSSGMTLLSGPPDKADNTEHEVWHVSHVFPGGPADTAGVRVGDLVESIDGSALTPSTTLDEIGALTDKVTYTLALRRSGAPMSLQVRPLHYAELVRSLGAQAPPEPK